MIKSKKQIDHEISKITAEISDLKAIILKKNIEINKLENMHEFRVFSENRNIRDDVLDIIKSDWLIDQVRHIASAACEGSHNCGSPQYDINFIDIDGTRKTATLEVRYNRHDKRYYYVDQVSLKSVVETTS